jgi:hypothetical protein
MRVELPPARWSKQVRQRVLPALLLMGVVAAVASFLTGAIPLGGLWSAAVAVATVGGIYTFGRDIVTSIKPRLRRPMSTELGRTPHLGLEFWQNQELAPMTLQKLDLKTVVVTHLRKDPFQMRIPNYTSNMQIYVCAWSDDAIFSLDDKETTADVEFLHGGTGIADSPFASATLFLRSDAHGHFTGNRIARIAENKAEIFFASVWQPGLNERTSLTMQERDIFLTVYIDQGVEEGLAAVDTARDYYIQDHPLRTSPGLPWYEYVVLRFR